MMEEKKQHVATVSVKAGPEDKKESDKKRVLTLMEGGQ